MKDLALAEYYLIVSACLIVASMNQYDRQAEGDFFAINKTISEVDTPRLPVELKGEQLLRLSLKGSSMKKWL